VNASTDISLVPLGGLEVEAGPDAGLVVGVGERPVTVGRETGCEIRLTDTSASRRHFRVGPDAAGRLCLEDLGSANGTFVDGQRLQLRILQPGDRIVAGETTLRFLSEAELLDALRRRAMSVNERDPVTGTCSRRLFDMRLRTEVTLSARAGSTLSLMIVQIDGLVALRAAHGGGVADRVLAAVGLVLGGYLRRNDLLARLDEDAFVVLIVDPSPNGAYLAGERMCAGIEGLAVDAGIGALHVTASIGVASEKGRRDLTAESFLDRARNEVVRARSAGGNCVSRWVHPSVREPIPSVSGDLRGTVLDLARETPLTSRKTPPPNRPPSEPPPKR
jgi:diguanylate cyclase (GGDEF)-like protein